jgi:hypothetical protein
MGLPTIAVPTYTLKLPSTDEELSFRPFLVKEEKLLLIAMEIGEKGGIVQSTKDIVKNCVYGDIDVNTMPAFDLEYVFLQLRGKAKGEVLELKYKCPKCEGEIPLNVNLDDIKVIKHKDHSKTIKLDENIGVVMKYPDLLLQDMLEKIAVEKTQIESLFETVTHCIDYIYDAETTYAVKDSTPTEISDFIESLTDAQFKKIAHFFETMPALKHEVKLICPQKVKGKSKEGKSCGYTENLVLEGLGSFFD